MPGHIIEEIYILNERNNFLFSDFFFFSVLQSRVIAQYDVWEVQWYVSLTRDWKWQKNGNDLMHCSAVELADLISSDLVEVYLLKILHTPTPPSLTQICIISYGAEFLA